jgi:hypothetical protein
MARLHVSLVAAALVATGLLASAASAVELKYSPVPPDLRILPISRMHVTMDVLVDGRPVRLIAHEGRLYLPVPRLGEEYTIRVNNHGPRRIAAIVSVDGLSVIDGRPASESSPGYLVDAYSHIVIKGWRRDRDTVAAFTFDERHNSYAYRRGYRDNIGVLGLVAFEEQRHTRIRPLDRPQENKALPRGKAGAAVGGTGTGWGRDIDSSVIYVPFVRSANKRTITVFYDTREALRRLGVPVDTVYPKPFPAEPRYAPPPPPR